MKEYSAYLLDFDGTLFDTLDSLVGVYQTAFREIGRDCTKDDVSFYMHMSLSETCDYLHIDDPKLREIFFKKVSEALDYPEYVEQIHIYPDVITTVKALLKKKKKVGIVSGNTEAHISLVLSRFNIKSLFSFYVGNSPTRKPKPSADPINYARTFLPALSPKEIVYVGDSLQDPETAKAAGVDGILLERQKEYPNYRGVKIASLKELLS
jgi:HAD superfamily hydrolase (TIGR01549 family)